METSTVMKALRRQGVEEIYLKILEDIHKESTAAIRLHNVSEKNSNIESGQTRRQYFS